MGYNLNRRRAGGIARANSVFEERLCKEHLKNWTFHPAFKVKYTIEHEYNPDFCKEIDGQLVVLEAKGIFDTCATARKYLYIRDVLESMGHRFVFLFHTPENKLPWARPRKDGTRQTMAEWAERHGFEYYSRDNLPDEFLA